MKKTIEVVHDTEPDTPNGIEAFIHCGRCLDEWKADPALSTTMAPKDYARTQTGIRADGNLQVWCNRHDCNVAVLSLRVKAERKEAAGGRRTRRARHA